MCTDPHRHTAQTCTVVSTLHSRPSDLACSGRSTIEGNVLWTPLKRDPDPTTGSGLGVEKVKGEQRIRTQPGAKTPWVLSETRIGCVGGSRCEFALSRLVSTVSKPLEVGA